MAALGGGPNADLVDLAIGTFVASLPLLRMTVAGGKVTGEPQSESVPTL
ncbi:hypothetical protein [Streptomyces neyagawaensis]|uniref:Uncharacterized protein n=1 Tax=Streptomyces neyagawaensis TaxID=42238 RepID=A0ABV3BAJ9_9ACTN